ncbi:MAG: NAD-dependent epimerase/dehydratase family protein [Candidatus Daviesbacteria bacterium]|nr:NAD-dependent epimerase/dehydratase family protein [Candidatus Daviesbacteria bacterium]
MKNKKILITGGTGFIGSWLIEKWYKNNQITLFDNGRRNAFQFLPLDIQKEIRVIRGDIQDIDAVKRIVKEKEIIIHLAAIAGASFYEKEPLLTLSVNMFGTANLLKCLLNETPEKVIIFSSSEVYGEKAEDVSEDDATCIGTVGGGRWSYAVSKLAGDHLAFAYFKKYNLPITIVRPFNIYGPRQVGESAISSMLTNVLKKGEIFVTGDGSQKRAWCYVSDLVQAVEDICKVKLDGECFNIGNPQAYLTILQLAEKIKKINPGSKIIFTDAKKTEIIVRKPIIKKAKERIKFSPSVSIDEGLELTLNWWIKNISKF